MKSLRLVVVRHARTALTSRVLNGCGADAANPPLDQQGSEQALRLVQRVPEASDRSYQVLSSPAARCTQTAAVWHRGVSEDPRLCEVDFGQWEGVSPTDLAVHRAQELAAWWSDPTVAPPGGTSLNERAQQWDALIADLMAAAGQHQRWIFVGHATTLRIAATRSLGVALDASSRISIPPAAVLRVRFWSDGGSTLDSLTSDEDPVQPHESIV